MDKETRSLTYFANKIQDSLIKLNSSRYPELLSQMGNLAELLKDMASESKKLSIALSHNWLLAADSCSGGIIRVVDDVSYCITTLKQLTDKTAVEVPSLFFIFDELKHLEQEFDQMEFNKAENTISLVTDPITLEDVDLGPFKIQLDLKKLSELYKNTPYHCIALEPNPAATNDEVTHPHVSNERLCEGDGSAAIRSALEQARLGDFFNIVKSILNTYSPDSPYVSLEDWSGIACYDCGCMIDSENTFYCHSCERDFCDNCASYCRSCDETCCMGCGGNCPNCDEFVCRNCIKTCSECGENFCKLCMEDDVCENCKEQQEESENTDENENKFKIAG
ncbi:MAG: hypothetical protein ABSE89_11355 [Sedimentisphaerales bacterium]